MIDRNCGAEPATMRIGARVSHDAIRPIARIHRDPGVRRHVRTLAIVLVFLGMTVSTATAQDALETRCRGAVSSVDQKAKNFYLICVDAFEKSHDAATLYCAKPNADDCSSQGELLDAGRSFVVVVWTDSNVSAGMELSGTAGFSRAYARSAEKLAFDGVEVVQNVEYFSPRKPGPVKLTVTVRVTSQELFTVERKYTIRGSYPLAIRLGLGISWAPWAREVGIRAAADGQRYAAVVSGADDGLVENELVAGISYFLLEEVKEDSLTPTLAIGVRLGVVNIGSDGGWFQSLMVGPELAIGPDLSIGLFGGIRRIDLPDAGHEPGRLVLPGTMEIPTHIGLTPAFGVVLNFTPGFLKFFGVKQ
jgi:hypothetical protein